MVTLEVSIFLLIYLNLRLIQTFTLLWDNASPLEYFNFLPSSHLMLFIADVHNLSYFYFCLLIIHYYYCFIQLQEDRDLKPHNSKLFISFLFPRLLLCSAPTWPYLLSSGDRVWFISGFPLLWGILVLLSLVISGPWLLPLPAYSRSQIPYFLHQQMHSGHVQLWGFNILLISHL